MKFFADTAEISEIRELAETGLLDGVTTNPSLVHKSGRDFLEVVREIAGVVAGPVSAEVVALDYDGMMREAEILRKIAGNIAIKVPLTPDVLLLGWLEPSTFVLVHTLAFYAAGAAGLFALVRRFQAEELPLLLVSLKAGGVGLNLTAADTVIHLDPWWNPAVQDQASARAHRIGQDKPVLVYSLVVEGSIEERMLELQRRKRALAEGILGSDPAEAAKFTEEDLKLLLAPLGA